MADDDDGGETQERLRSYRARRDFAATSEPTPDGEPEREDASGERTPGRERDVAAPPRQAPRFVIQQHHATRLHWDLRLEHDGALASWALPRGIPLDPSDNRIAVHTEDHPLAYLEFHGEIPAGSYGAGTMEIWDHGTYDCHEWTDRKVEVTLHGERVSGRYGLFPIGRRGRADEWMIHRIDPPQDPQRVPLPEHLVPMLARAGELPGAGEDEQWSYEVKWDGVRALLWSDHGHVRIESRTQREISDRYPEVRAIGRALGARELLLDGEIVALDEQGRPSFERLQRRMNVAGDAAVRRVARSTPVTYVIFDLLHLDGRSLLDAPYERRRELLDGLALEGDGWRTPAAHRGDGEALLAATRAQGLEGIVAKRVESRYEPGRRSGAWRKLRNRHRQELVIGGWTPGEGRRSRQLGSLQVGVPESPDGPLRYAGGVGSGFSEAVLDDLIARLQALRRETSPFAPAVGRDAPKPPRGTQFVEPRLVAEVEFSEWTREGILRQPVFKGLRDDKAPRDVVREPQTEDVAESVVPALTVLGPVPGADALEAEVDGRRLKITNHDKVLFPAAGFTKGDLIAYYVKIAPTLLAHLRDRPVTLRRWPSGVDGQSFYEKNCPGHRPEWVETASVYSSNERGRIDFCLAQDAATLAWFANLAAIELHPSLALARAIDRPTAVVFDLDPGAPAGLAQCAEVALLLEGLFGQLGLRSVVKTSGSKGLQVYVPLGTGAATYERTKPFARQVAELLERRLPELVVARMTKRLRAGKVFVDWSQNDQHKTTVAAYSVRAREQPTVSTPLGWDELRSAHEAGETGRLVFDAAAVLARVDELGDLFAPMLGLAQELPEL
ncbi:MAG: ligase [Conexibacter sp.]|nr:ligase [Conexibacter sp.]